MNFTQCIVNGISLALMFNILMTVDKINVQLVTVQKLMMEKGE